MSSYVCVSLDEYGQCLEWAQTMSMSALSYEDGGKIAAVIITCWALAYGVREVVRFVINRP